MLKPDIFYKGTAHALSCAIIRKHNILDKSTS